jgi:hypothetical protein
MKFNTKNLTITNSYANYEVLEKVSKSYTNMHGITSDLVVNVTTNIEMTWSFKSYNQLTNEVEIDIHIDESVRYTDDYTEKFLLNIVESRALFSMIEDEVEQDASEYGLCEWLEQDAYVEFERIEDTILNEY